MEEKEIRRDRMSAKARERRRKRRKKAVMMERIIVALLIVTFIVGGTVLAWNLVPGIKVSRHLDEANAFMETAAYDDAIASCEEALKIDSMSIKAYRAMAGVYLTKEDRRAAEQVLYRGWETTKDEGLLQEYCIQLLNDAVADINAQNCTLNTLEKCVTAVGNNPTGEDGFKLLEACYNRLFMTEETELFCNINEDGICGFDQYLELMNRMILVYEQNPTEELKAEVIKYAVPQNAALWMEVSHIQDYLSLLERVAKLDENGQTDKLRECLGKAGWIQNIFKEAFDIFEAGEFEPIKEFMQSEEYITIRDQFIDGTMEYWDGKTYIPVSREKMKLIWKDEQWKFSFADFDECPETTGVIKVWGTKQEDAGVQRLCISYEPASEDGSYYPHITYEFVYLYSNVKIGGEYVPQMNYRFETRIATPQGTSAELIGDWGGEHEWTMEY
ncbi:MAG: hypothetical protein ACI4E5_01070 [Suilimivivens sp.]